MQVAIRENHKAAVLRAGVLAGLLLADERVLVFCLGLKDQQRKALGVEKQEVDKAPGRLFEVVAECVKIGRLDRDAGFEADIGGGATVCEEAPISRFEQLVDLDAGGSFFVGHSDSSLTGAA
jgi:hypothetical protein